ncbi:MAG TPA: hypothetical protein VE177_01630, partial [Candidatus Binatus sp.]|nr:hypothetical protein [Candidatus Binatus sp.]
VGFAGGFFTAIIFILLSLVDFGLTFIGPFLFLYGAVNLSSGLALKFHKRFSTLSKRFIGDIAILASKSVFRNPRRAAATVFLVALIAGYSIWVIGDLASMQDYTVRQSLARVGGDLRISNLPSFSNATSIANQLSNWGNVSAVTPELSTSLSSASQSQISVRAVDPMTWTSAAYYEDGWFSANPNRLFDVMKGDSSGIILEKGLATYYNIAEGANVTIVSSAGRVNLHVIGFLGPDYANSNSQFITPLGGVSFFSRGWSYISLVFVTLHSDLFSSGSGYSVIVKTKNTTPDQLGNSVQALYPYATVDSGAAGPSQGGVSSIFSGLLNVLRLGVVFAAAVAGIGVAAVTYTGFKEREKETTMVAVRGFSYRQLLGLLVTEVLPLVVFALILAGIVGLITVRGDTLALDQISSGQDFYSLLVRRRIVFPMTEQLILGTIIGLLLGGVFLPALLSARKDLSKMSRTVRFA